MSKGTLQYFLVSNSIVWTKHGYIWVVGKYKCGSQHNLSHLSLAINSIALQPYNSLLLTPCHYLCNRHTSLKVIFEAIFCILFKCAALVLPKLFQLFFKVLQKLATV